MLLHTLQFRDLFKVSHFTFLHGQNIKYYFLNELIQALEEIQEPPSHPSLTKRLRPLHTPLHSMDKIREKVLRGDSDHRPELSANLISCDAFFLSEKEGESANYFVRHNGNVYDRVDATLCDLLYHYLESSPSLRPTSLIQNYQDRFHEIIDQHTQNTPDLGVYYTIAIPKEECTKTHPENFCQQILGKSPSLSPLYASLPYGLPCLHKEEPQEILSSLQSNRLPSSFSFPKTPPPTPLLPTYPHKINRKELKEAFHRPSFRKAPSFPQYRLNTKSLRSKNVYIEAFPPFNETQKRCIEWDIQKLAREILLKKPLNQDPLSPTTHPSNDEKS